MAPPIVHRVDRSALVARARNMLIGVWWRSATLEHAEAIRECTELILAEHAGFATAVLVLDGQDVYSFPDDVRRALVDVVKQTEEEGLGTAFVVFRGGFVGGAIRAFATGVFLVARSKEPQRAFADVASAAAWLATKATPDAAAQMWSSAELERTLDEALALATAVRDQSPRGSSR